MRPEIRLYVRMKVAGIKVILLVRALRALVKSPFCPQRFTSVHSEATETPALAIFTEWTHEKRRKYKVNTSGPPPNINKRI